MVNGVVHFNLVSPLIYYFSDGYYTNLWTNIEDIPIIKDVNGDGYLDYLTYGIFGTSVVYYQNETYFLPNVPHYNIDSFQYSYTNPCWGNFTQNASNNSITINDTDCIATSPCSNVHVTGPPEVPRLAPYG